jgi:hypothetical protein
METTRPTRRVSKLGIVVSVAVVAIALVYSWVASGLRPFTHPMAVAVSVPLVIAGIAILGSRRRLDVERRTAEPVPRRGTWVWILLLLVLLAWELISYRMSPRIDHPTLSSIADAFMEVRPRRFALFVAWLALGFWLFRR